MAQVVTIGLDIAKSVFQVHGVGGHDHRGDLSRARASGRLIIGASAPTSLGRAALN
jgi:hypothetical protein